MSISSAARARALRVLRDGEREALRGWVLPGAVSAEQRRAVEAAARQGLAELAGPEVRAELSVAHAGRPVLWAARLTGQGHDAVAYAEASEAPLPRAETHEAGADEEVVELRPTAMDVLRVFVRLGPELRVPPAEGLAERVRTAFFDRSANCWTLCLNSGQMQSAAYAFHLHALALSGTVTEANRFAREHGFIVRLDESTGSLRVTRLR
ncbi:DUF6417 family protein [Streptomyces sp. NPDC049954]|uniref:DUF6417 family protein n=1 Tax=Streptomyces sp. NPDC049954 TaxID=3155779 RepID=UPI00343C01A8